MSPTTEREVLEQEARLADAKRALDLEAFQRLYADDLLLTGVMGEPSCTKAAVIQEAQRGLTERERARASGQTVDISTESQDMRVVRHGDAAVASYRVVVSIKRPGVDAQHRYRTTNVWMKRDVGWQIVAAHTTFVLDPKQAAALSSGSVPPA